VYNKEPVAIKTLILPTGALSLGNEDVPEDEIITEEEKNEILNIFDEFRREVIMMRFVLFVAFFLKFPRKLNHPCIVNIKGYTINPFSLVMEKLNKGNLYTFLHDDKNKISWKFRITVAINIAAGMAFLHGLEPKILHNDLKRFFFTFFVFMSQSQCIIGYRQ
jgi:serine/threonine protein kinase